VKDTWVKKERRHEGELYEQLGPIDGVVKMLGYEVVYANGHEDQTYQFAHRQCPLKNERYRLIPNARLPGLSLTPETSSRGTKTSRNNEIAEFQLQEVEATAQIFSREHRRVVMMDAGWPIRKFLDLPEMIGALHDAVAGKSCLW
jgi:hypothetical protein